MTLGDWRTATEGWVGRIVGMNGEKNEVDPLTRGGGGRDCDGTLWLGRTAVDELADLTSRIVRVLVDGPHANPSQK